MTSEQTLALLRTHFAERYLLESLLGRGGSARVFTVKNIRLGRLEALKVLSEANQDDPDFAERFTVEAKVAASLDHPNIVKVYDFGELDGIFWYSMQLIEGPTLSNEIWSRGTFDQMSAARLSLPLLHALHYSHSRGVVHRDIKPANILIDQDGRPYLMDFGIAKSTDGMMKTRTGLVLGTPLYVSPEQAAGQPIDGRADLYSLGVTLYQMVSGAFPFTADSPLISVVMRMTLDPEPLRDKLPEVDRDFESIVMRALARDRDERFSDAQEMLERLVDYCGGESEDAVVLPTSQDFGVGKPLPPADSVNTGVSPTLVTTNGSEALELRGLRRGRVVRRLYSVAMVAVAGIVFFLGFQVVKPWFSDRGASSVDLDQKTLPSPMPEVTDRVDSQAEDSHEQELESLAETAAVVVPTQTPVPVPTVVADPPARRAFTPPLQLTAEEAIRVPLSLAEICQGHRISLSVRVAEDGSVTSAKVISSGHPEVCTAHAREVVNESYRFKPAEDVDGIPVAAPLTMAFDFDLVVHDVLDS